MATIIPTGVTLFHLNQSSHANLGAYWLAISVTLSQKFVPVFYGGIFPSSVENIYKQDMKMWKKFTESVIRGDNIEEGHLERDHGLPCCQIHYIFYRLKNYRTTQLGIHVLQ